MNALRTPTHRAAAIAAALALTLAACGGDDDTAADDMAADDMAADDTTPEDTATGAGDGAAMPPTQPATVTADAQSGDGSTVTVASVELPAAGFIAVHGDGGGSPGPVIGHSEALPAGSSTDVVIVLDEPLTASGTVFPMAHIDVNGNGVYEFTPPDETTDGPALTADGDVAVVPLELTVDGSTSGASDEGAAAATAEIRISDFAFSGVAEIAVGTTVTVINDDGTPHTWTAVDGPFDSGTINPGESFEFTFTEAGEFDYFCNFHPSMTGTVVVTG